MKGLNCCIITKAYFILAWIKQGGTWGMESNNENLDKR